MSETRLDLDGFNAMRSDDLRPLLREVCTSPAWIDAILADRPYADSNALLERSDATVAGLDDNELAAALVGHPRIGDRVEASSRSAREQSAMAGAADTVAERIRQGNLTYEQRFGHVYLVCATGRSPEELLEILERRLSNEPEHERDIVKTELAAINRLRLKQLLGLASAQTSGRAPS